MSVPGPDLLAALAAFALGAALGTLHFLSLKAGVRMLAAGRLVAPLALLPVRFAVLALAFYAVARAGGALSLLAAAAGLLVARAVILRRERADG